MTDQTESAFIGMCAHSIPRDSFCSTCHHEKVYEENRRIALEKIEAAETARKPPLADVLLDHAELLQRLMMPADISEALASCEDAAVAIRALEAKVQDLECQLDADGVSDMRNELAHVRVDRDGIAARLETYRDKWNSASADRDRLAAENAALRAASEVLLEAARIADWEQVRLNGGPPCFYIEDGRFCLRAHRWMGHDSMHKFTTLDAAIDAARR